MQATVYRYDPVTGAGAVLTDQGAILEFGVEAMRASGLRKLRPGQRLSLETEGQRITRLALGTITAEPDQSRS